MPDSWDITTGNNMVTVGVIDSGIKRAHSDLKANVDTELSKSFVDSDPFTDEDGHGTKIAGVIGAVGNNQKGVAGCCWNIKLVSLKVCSPGNNKSSTIALAIDYAEANDIDILNLSRSVQKDSYALKYAIQNYSGLLVCSAGNRNLDVDSSSEWVYPSKYGLPNMISVAAIDENDQLAYWGIIEDTGLVQKSNYGVQSVNLAAPGNNLYTTNIGETSDLYYTYFNGTSSATPCVAGVAALIKSKYPTITNYGMRSAILDSVEKVNTLNGKVKSGGILNAYNALNDVEKHKFTVVYDKNGGLGTTMSSTTVLYGIPTKLSVNTYTPDKTGYKFAGWYAHRDSDDKWFYTGEDGSGWYTEGSQPSGYTKNLYSDEATIAHTSGIRNDTVTMYAQWEPIRYNFVFDPNGGSNDVNMSQQTITYGINTSISENIYTRAGYNFIGWYANRSSDNKWYYTDGTNTGWYVEGTQPDGYTKFRYNDKAIVSKTSAVDGDIITMYAQWNPISYNIIFDPNGGSGASPMLAQTITYDVHVNISQNLYSKIGHHFLGWHAKRKSDNKWFYSDGNSTGWYVEDDQPSGYTKFLYSNQSSIANVTEVDGDVITMYAQWLINSYTVTFDSNGGNGNMLPISGISEEPLTLTANAFTKEDYSFLGWYLCDVDGYWSYEDDVWDTESDTEKKLYYDTDKVSYLAYNEGDNVTAVAQWIKTSSIILGDSNLDGTINVNDALFIQKYLAGLINLSEANAIAADVNRDGVVDINDATLIQSYVSGDIIEF